MLTELSIKNFAIIESLTLSFDKGLTVFTGETGAGKSIIIDAIGLLSGGRGSAAFVRHGSSEAELEGLFLLEEGHACLQKADQLGIDTSDGMIVLRRTISEKGKSVCRINGRMMTLNNLKEIGQSLIDIHGQHEHQDLMQTSRHLPLLDSFGKASIQTALTQYKEVFQEYEDLRKQLRQLTESEQEMAHRIDLIQFQLEEISRANLQENEDKELESEKVKLSNYEKLFTALNDSYYALYGENKALDFLRHAMNDLETIANIDNDFKTMHENIANSYYLLEETTFALRDHSEQLEYDPSRLNAIETRLYDIENLKRKYGETVCAILEYAASIDEEMNTLTNRDQHLESLQKQMDEVLLDVIDKANILSEARQATAKKLINTIQGELKELHMEKTRFDITFTRKKGNNDDPMIDGSRVHFQKEGFDEVEFLISTNPGEPLKSLSKVASGGELSRIMLALKSMLSEDQGVTSIIFDEVDTGVSGRVAQAMAEKIFKLSVSSQVFCITHLPQVAAMADTHFFIEKEEEENRTKTTVCPLNNENKVSEIGRMISGVEMTDLTKQHANELLQLATDMKNTS